VTATASVQFQTDFKEQYLASLAFTTHSAGLLAWAALFPAFGLAFLAFIVGYAGRGPKPFELVIVLLCLGFTPLTTALNVWLFRRRNPSARVPHTYVLSEDALRISSPLADTQLRWAAVTRAVETGRFFLFFLSPRGGLFLPKHAVASEADLLAIRELAGRVGAGTPAGR
jgi:hypothetical protein